MIALDSFVLFCLSALALIVVPGPNMVYIATRSATAGWKAGLVAAAGVDLATAIHVLLAVSGGSALLLSSPAMFTAVKFGGAAYLIYLGASVLLRRATAETASAAASTDVASLFGQGFATNLLNPKVAIFFLAFLPQFTDPSRGELTRQLLVLGLTFAVLGFLVDVIVALLAGALGGWLSATSRAGRTQQWLAGGVYIGLGVSAALLEVPSID